MKNAAGILLALGLASGLLTGCEYGDGSAEIGAPEGTRGYTMASQFRANVGTVHVPIWSRDMLEYRRDLEIHLTEAICKHIGSDTPYRLADKARADTELKGTLRSVEQRVLSYDPRTGIAREIQMRMTVDFTWTDLRTGEVLVEKKDFLVAADYIPPAPFSENFFLGSRDDFDKLAERIVEKLRSPW